MSDDLFRDLICELLFESKDNEEIAWIRQALVFVFSNFSQVFFLSSHVIFLVH